MKCSALLVVSHVAPSVIQPWGAQEVCAVTLALHGASLAKPAEIWWWLHHECGPAQSSAWTEATSAASGDSAVFEHLQAQCCLSSVGGCECMCLGWSLMSLWTAKVLVFIPTKLSRKYELKQNMLCFITENPSICFKRFSLGNCRQSGGQTAKQLSLVMHN